ncbi:hypothetical protein DL771_002619 [Monosporascus sp. 5C6A]|nr:hypothetical protein DL771_002619 [Monosporascus sp. 5C6A]
MPGKHQKHASKPSRRKHQRGSSSAGSRQPDHAHRHERSYPPTIDGRDLESEMDGYNGTTWPVSSSGGHDDNFATHQDFMMEPAPTEHSMPPYSDGYDPNIVGVVSHSGTYPSGSTLYHSSSTRRNDTPTDPYQQTGASTANASSGTQDLRVNDNSGEAELCIADILGLSVSGNILYSSLISYVGNEDLVTTDAIAGVDINQPAETTAHHSPPSSVNANMGSAQVSPVVQQERMFDSYQPRWPGRDRRVEATATMGGMPHWAVVDGEGPWNSHDAALRYHHQGAVAPNAKDR